MKPINLLIIMHALMVVAFIVCITWAAICFNRYGLLWWYLVPAMLESVSLQTTKVENEEDKT